MYAGWHYVVIEAGPQQAATWRDPGSFFTGVLPNLIFPGDRSWLVSTLWDDDWTCIGGPAELVQKFVRQPGLQGRPVVLGQDATPPGHQAFCPVLRPGQRVMGARPAAGRSGGGVRGRAWRR
jgi:hypothetical protein